MDRTPFICGNWKLNHDLATTRRQVRALVEGIAGLQGVEVGVAPVATTLFAAGELARGTSLRIAAQRVHWQPKGAFTGEIAVSHAAEVGCTHVIVGHSECREFFGDTDAIVGKKVRAVFDGGLTPIACVGETLVEREADQTMTVVGRQLKAILDVVARADGAKLVIAYEPVWAIGTGKVATPAQAQEVHAAIRAQLKEKLGATADLVRLQYGGSVKPENAAELMAQPDVDGALVGGASLEAASLLAIARAALA